MTKVTAEDWITRKLKELCLPEPHEMYHKGDEYKGITFAKYRTPEEVTKVTEAFDKGQFKIADKPIWSKRDLPLEARVPKSFLLGLRHHLTQWDFTKREVKVDEVGKTLSVAGMKS